MLNSMFEKNAIKYCNNTRGNRIDGRNIGISVATGDYICFLDDDDTCINNRLQIQSDLLDANPDIDVVSCTTLFDNRNGLMHTLKNMKHEEITELLNTDLDIDHLCNFQSCMFRRSTLEKYFDKNNYFYKEYISGGEGQALLYTLYFNGCKFMNTNETIYIYNLCKADNSLSKNIIPTYYNETLLEKSMKEKKNIITNLYNKLKGLFVNQEKLENTVVEEPVKEETVKETIEEKVEEIATEKPKRSRKKKIVEEKVEEITTEKPKRGRKKKVTE
jgi:glycosyltransferase involved in cell wall biosynthesis